MRVRHYPSVDSHMARYWREGDTFEVYDSGGQVVMTLSGTQLMQILASHAAQAQIVLDFAHSISHLSRDLYPKRRLLNQHKVLRMSAVAPHQPHDPSTDGNKLAQGRSGEGPHKGLSSER